MKIPPSTAHGREVATYGRMRTRTYHTERMQAQPPTALVR